MDRLQPLLPFQDSTVGSSQDQDTMIQLSRQELQQIVMRVVVSVKASVRNGTKKPTGMHISDLGPKPVTLSLSWVNAFEENGFAFN